MEDAPPPSLSWWQFTRQLQRHSQSSCVKCPRRGSSGSSMRYWYMLFTSLLGKCSERPPCSLPWRYAAVAITVSRKRLMKRYLVSVYTGKSSLNSRSEFGCAMLSRRMVSRWQLNAAQWYSQLGSVGPRPVLDTDAQHPLSNFGDRHQRPRRLSMVRRTVGRARDGSKGLRSLFKKQWST